MVLSHEFSQQQRLILEKWMVETSPTAQAKLVPKQLTWVGSGSNEDEESQKDKGHEPCQALALLPSTKFNQPAASSRKRQKRGAVPTPGPSRGVVGCVKKIKAAYRACICFDAIEIYTGQSDLPTALEYLVILTTMKAEDAGQHVVQRNNRRTLTGSHPFISWRAWEGISRAQFALCRFSTCGNFHWFGHPNPLSHDTGCERLWEDQECLGSV